MTPVFLSWGTLKSTRMSTRLPESWRSRMDLNLDMVKGGKKLTTDRTDEHGWMKSHPCKSVLSVVKIVRFVERLELGGDLLGEIDDAVGVAALVVIPGDELEELGVQLDGGAGVEDRGELVVDEVGGGDFVLGVAEDVLEVGLGGLLHGGLDLGEGGFLLGANGEVNDGDGRGGNAEGHAGELALDLGEHERGGLGGAGRGRDDVDGGAAATLPVLLGGTVHGLLGRGVGVDGGHETLDHAEAFLEEHGDDRREAVRGAGGVGDDAVLGEVELVVVDAEDDGDVLALGRGGDDDLLGAGGDVTLGLLGLGEE